MKSIRKLRSQKGFTLVECIIAIAVFAIMTVMVIMIIGMAQKTQLRATASEEDLDTLVQNVVADDTFKQYSSSTHDPLKLKINSSSENFSMTYNIVDGNKNWVYCDFVDPATSTPCGYSGDNKRFMWDFSTNTEVSVSSFDPTNANMGYRCPQCGNKVNQTLKCLDCANEASYESADTDAFSFDRSTGGYYCKKCGSSNVKGKDVEDLVTADGMMNISGIFADKIRYSDVTTPILPEANIQITGKDGTAATTGDKVMVSLTCYQHPSDPNLDYYKMTVGNIVDSAGNVITDPRNVIIMLPVGYDATVTKQPSSVTPTSAKGLVMFSKAKSSDGIDYGTKVNYLVITNYDNSCGTINFEFTLKDSVYGVQSFENDYSADGGLLEKWFDQIVATGSDSSENKWGYTVSTKTFQNKKYTNL